MSVLETAEVSVSGTVLPTSSGPTSFNSGARIRNLSTGNPVESELYRFLVASSERAPAEVADAYRCGVVSMYFTWVRLSQVTGLPRHDAIAILERLSELKLLRYERFLAVGVHVWLLRRVEQCA